MCLIKRLQKLFNEFKMRNQLAELKANTNAKINFNNNREKEIHILKVESASSFFFFCLNCVLKVQF